MTSPSALEPLRRVLLDILEQPDHADGRRRRDRAPLGLVVEAHVAADHRHAQRDTRVADAAHRLGELPHHLGLLGIAEVEAVGDAERLGAGADDVARAFDHGDHCPDVRVQGAVAAVAVDAQRDPLMGALDAQDGGVGPGLDDGVAAHQVVVLPVHPPLRRDVRRVEQGQQRLVVVAGLRDAVERNSCCASKSAGGASGRSYAGASSVSSAIGRCATSSPRNMTRNDPSSVT